MAARTTQSYKPVTISRWRINAVLLASVVALAVVSLRLGNLQIVQSGELSKMARGEINQTLEIPARRGTIRDSAGNVLALDVERESAYVVPPQIKTANPQELALKLSLLLGKPAPDILAILQDKTKQWVPLKRWLDPEIAEQVNKLAADEPGLRLQYEPRRLYPQGTFAVHAVGATNMMNTGINGVEGYYDDVLKGATGAITTEVDSQSHPIWIAPQESVPATQGADLVLTLDPLVQHVIEGELKAAVEQHSASGGTVIVLDPKTGAIRGLANYPTYDPNRYNEYAEDMWVNQAISGNYEPGSTFKILTVAAGLQAHAFTADTTVNDTGVIDRYGWSLANWDSNGHGLITPGEVLKYSSNVGALQLNELTGPERFYKAVSDFGFGQPTGVDMAGEAAGIVHDENSAGWDPLLFDTNAYGQGIAVTPLQLVRMVAAVGNDGKVMKPYIVQQRCLDGVCEDTRPEQVGQPIGRDVAWTLRRMLIVSANNYVNDDGTGTKWLMPGYEVCAKTGTASIPENGVYNNDVIGSVLGIAPAEDARYAILVKIDRPQDDPWGVLTALPVYEKVVEQLMRYERIAPDPSKAGPGQTPGIAYQSGQ